MTAQERIAGAHERLQRRTLSRRVKKALLVYCKDWPEDSPENEETDPLIKVCQQDPSGRIGITFESISCPSFSTILKSGRREKKLKAFEEALTRSTETYGGSRKFIGVSFEVFGGYFVYTDNPDVEHNTIDFLRITFPDGAKRYILSLDEVLEAISEGALS